MRSDPGHGSGSQLRKGRPAGGGGPFLTRRGIALALLADAKVSRGYRIGTRRSSCRCGLPGDQEEITGM